MCHGNVERQFKATESRQDHFGRECYGYNITKLNLDDGHVVLEGELSAMFYEEPRQERGSLFSRMFR